MRERADYDHGQITRREKGDKEGSAENGQGKERGQTRQEGGFFLKVGGRGRVIALRRSARRPDGAPLPPYQVAAAPKRGLSVKERSRKETILGAAAALIDLPPPLPHSPMHKRLALGSSRSSICRGADKFSLSRPLRPTGGAQDGGMGVESPAGVNSPNKVSPIVFMAVGFSQLAISLLNLRKSGRAISLRRR